MAKPINLAGSAERRTYFLLTTALVTLVSMMAGIRPVCAQSVTGNGVTSSGGPGGIVSPNWTVGGDLDVGASGPTPGFLKIENGGTVTNNDGVVGNGASYQGEVTVSGRDGTGNASTWTNNGDLTIGQDGKGMLSVINGGVVNSAWSYIGAGANGQGDVTILGRDVDGNASIWTITGQFYIGESGAGTLNISDGGTVSSSVTTIGNSSNGVGTVTVSGHDGNGNVSTWNNANQLHIGDGGVGTLNILNGGVVNSGQGLIGSNAGANSVTVSGHDGNGHASTWNAANNIYVGYYGNGALSVEDGAQVATSATGGGAASIYVGHGAGSTGSVVVSSSNGALSSLSASDRIELGYGGTGEMTVSKGGFVSAGSAVYLANSATGSATLHLDGDPSGRGILETGAVIKGSGSSAVLDLDGGILRANRDQANFLNGFSSVAVAAGGAWFDTNGYDIAIGTDFSGSSSFDKFGLGQLTLTGDSSGFYGDSTVSAGTLAVNGILGGNMLVDTSGRLAGTGHVGPVVNTGVVAPGYGGMMGTLTIDGDYTSNGGRLEIAAVLGDDNSQTSLLVVDGSTSGLTLINVINQGGLGAQTVEGIKIVDVAGASNGSFVLDGNYLFEGDPSVIAGAYAYRLYQGGVSDPTDGDWYLRSVLVNTPLYQPGVPIYEAYGANLQSINTLPTLQQRVGSRFQLAGVDSDGSGFWGRMEGTYGRFDDARISTTGMDHRIDTWKIQLGADGLLAEDHNGGSLIAGINLSYGEANSRIKSVFGNGALKSEGYGIGATLTWYDGAGFYADAQAQIGRYGSDLRSELLGILANNNGGQAEAFSVEVGKRLSVDENLGITPQFQMVYSNVRFDRFVDPAGAVVTADGNDSLMTRWGVAFDYQSSWEGRNSRAYGIANLSYEWLDGTQASVAGTAIQHASERLTAEIGLGASMDLQSNIALYGEVLAGTPISSFGKSYALKGNLGLRMQF
ncbi:autotransporter outer membrane beta-barrel domain-containing protein [Shinella zoogloeoides]|uniref:autotransporter family protein n=1 Tax=Shinella zoogloeoides TaxID=352475 RepID=UPI00299F3309|nr:autotransporter outer membrane beta-barrel domain-containing protein [Shinella zoogloeoides]